MMKANSSKEKNDLLTICLAIFVVDKHKYLLILLAVI